MPTNAELITIAEGLAAALDIEITTDGLTNKQLVELVTDLKAKQTDAETVTQADEPTADEPQADEPTVYVIAKGKAILAKSRTLSGDKPDVVTADDLHGGEESLQAFIKSGHIVKR